GIMTSWKTSHGPEKSIITAPSETRKAIGIVPCAGGVSESPLPFCPLPPGVLVAPTGSELAQTEKAIAAINPNSAALRSSSFPLSVFVPLYMTGSFSGRCGGSNDNYRLNPAMRSFVILCSLDIHVDAPCKTRRYCFRPKHQKQYRAVLLTQLPEC